MVWIREGFGWFLVVVGLLTFAIVHDYCERRWMFEAAILVVPGIFVFRGGIHLLKVSIRCPNCPSERSSSSTLRTPAPRFTGALTAPRSPRL
jgi:vacuolar-type H+-ATPase subunit I/STV1